jgi:glycosyltransferase involved in cell wall biosynthesis
MYSADPEPQRPYLRILVCPHELITGGSQLSAIDLAARLRDRGHTVQIYAPHGPLERRIADLGLAYRAAPQGSGRSLRPRSLYRLAREIRRFRPDIVHSYEAPPAVASAAVRVAVPHRAVVTVLSMEVPDFIPRDVPLIVGTARLARDESKRRRDVRLMEPPIDVDLDAPRTAAGARAALGVARSAFVVSVVGRLSAEHDKARGVVAAIEALDGADLPRPVVLIVAGAGDRGDAVRRAADAVRNPRLTVRLEGDIADPRQIFAAADVVLGMGSAALRAMSHERPVIVQGTGGFWQTLTPENSATFLRDGFFGHGPSGAPTLERQLAALMADPHRAADLGRYGRALVMKRFDIASAARMLEEVYAIESVAPRRTGVRASAATALRYARYRIVMVAPVVQRIHRRIRRNHG